MKWPTSPRALSLTLASAFASCIALAAWAASANLPEAATPGAVALSLPAGPSLDRLLDDVEASPTQRAQTHQIVEATRAGLRHDRDGEGADRERLAQLFAQPQVDASAVEAVRLRVAARDDAASRRIAQAMIAVSLVLSPGQRQRIARQMAAGPHPFAVARAPFPVFNE